MDYEYIEKDAQVEEFRRAKAIEMEQMAIMAEVEAEQFAEAAKALPKVSSLHTQAKFYAENAKTQRAAADEVVKLSKADRGEIAEQIMATIRDRLASAEADHARQTELLKNAKAYDYNAEQAKLDQTVLEKGILALRKHRDSLQKDAEALASKRAKG